jgi:hypothetical protein
MCPGAGYALRSIPLSIESKHEEDNAIVALVNSRDLT